MQEKITEKQAIDLLRRYASDEHAYKKVMEHSVRVKNIVLKLVDGITKGVDLDFLKTAALLHDIGRFKYPPGSKDSIKHGIYGGEILKKHGLYKHARVCETHIGVGITKDDILAQNLPLPLRDFVPESVEEILIAYSDNLDSPGISSERDVEERFAREVGEGYRNRVQLFHKKVHEILEKLKTY
ncbi:HD domain-containing protein [Desulfothermus okinawensis JCM 13304]